jgi:hypothetical protein
MCFLGSNRDATQNSSKNAISYSGGTEGQKKFQGQAAAEWKWGSKPHDCDNQIAKVKPLDLVLPLLSLRTSNGWTTS